MYRPVAMYCDSQENPNGLPAYHWCEGILKIDTLCLFEATCNKSGFEFGKISVESWLEFVDPTGGNGLGVGRKRDKRPSVVFVDRVDFLLHSHAPIRVVLSLLEGNVIREVFWSRVKLKMSSEFL